ncbi:MAG: PAS domain S-box protein, partial [Sphingomonadales bacterium]
KIKASEARVSGILEISAEAIISLDRNFDILFFNRAAEATFGYKSSEVIGRHFEILIPEGLRKSHVRHVEDFESSNKTVLVMAERPGIMGRHKDGTFFQAEASVSKLELNTETIYTVILRDITERVKAAEALRISEGNLANAQRIASIGSWDWDPATGALWWSDENFRIYELKPGEDEPSYEMFLDYVHPNDRAAVNEAVRAALEDDVPYRIDHRVILKNGEIRTLRERAEVYRTDRGEPTRMSGTVLDITERIRAEEAMRKGEEQLRQAQKMEVVGQLTGGVAHDFNNMLAVILGNVELASDNLDGNEVVAASLDLVQRAAKRGADLTQRLLAFSRQQVLAPVVLDLNEVVENTTELCRLTLGARVELSSRLDPDLWYCPADRSQIETAVLNLALNARDAMPDGGHLTIETGNRTVDKKTAAEMGAKPGEYVLLSVTDTGEGIAPENLQHIFEPFFTTKEVGAGSGLGLSMIYGFVKQSGGHVTVKSDLGQGTTFRLYLPRSKEAPKDKKQAAVVINKSRAPDAKIFVVEDDPDVRQLTVTMLRGIGYTVEEAGSAVEALEMIRKNPDLDMLLSDVVLPGGMSGPELAGNLRQFLPDLKVMFMSGYTEKAIGSREKMGGSGSFIQKPFGRKEMAEKVAQTLSQD